MEINAMESAHVNGRAKLSLKEDGPVEPVQYLSPEGTLVPGRRPPISDTDALKLFDAMLRNRLIDERMITLQRQGRIGFYIGSAGEEACIIGPIAAMRPDDWLFPCYRENGGYLLRGLPFQRFVDNLFGNASDPVQGRQMPNHIAWKKARIMSVSSPIGTQIAQATGAAYAARLLGRDDAMVAYFGEGATSSNDFHTGLNFAGVWKAPAVFVCRNNHWAISVPFEKQTAAPSIASKAAGYGMPGVRVDGNDLFACYAVASDALARARAGGGPTLIEAVTYRISGHSTSDDPNVYRSDDEVAPWRARDPLLRLRLYFAARGLWDDEREAKLRADVDEACKSAVRSAEAAPPPALETAFSDVFSSMPWHLAEQFEEAASYAGEEAEDRA